MSLENIEYSETTTPCMSYYNAWLLYNYVDYVITKDNPNITLEEVAQNIRNNYKDTVDQTKLNKAVQDINKYLEINELKEAIKFYHGHDKLNVLEALLDKYFTEECWDNELNNIKDAINKHYTCTYDQAFNNSSNNYITFWSHNKDVYLGNEIGNYILAKAICDDNLRIDSDYIVDMMMYEKLLITMQQDNDDSSMTYEGKLSPYIHVEIDKKTNGIKGYKNVCYTDSPDEYNKKYSYSDVIKELKR